MAEAPGVIVAGAKALAPGAEMRRFGRAAITVTRQNGSRLRDNTEKVRLNTRPTRKSPSAKCCEVSVMVPPIG